MHGNRQDAELRQRINSGVRPSNASYPIERDDQRRRRDVIVACDDNALGVVSWTHSVRAGGGRRPNVADAAVAAATSTPATASTGQHDQPVQV